MDVSNAAENVRWLGLLPVKVISDQIILSLAQVIQKSGLGNNRKKISCYHDSTALGTTCEAELNSEQQDCTLLLENMKAIFTLLLTPLYKRLSLQISFHKANAFNASTDWSIWNTYNIITIRIISPGMLEKDTEPLTENLLC